MSSTEPKLYSSLPECIILATICSRALSHKHVSTLEIMYGSAPADFCVRHEWLERMITRRLEILQKSYPVLSLASDPMLVFSYMLAQATVMYLCCIMDPLSEREEYGSLPWEFQEKGLLAAREIARLATEHIRLGYFRAHTFMPAVLLVSASRLMVYRNRQIAAVGPEDLESIEQPLRAVLGAMGKLEAVNSISTHYLRCLAGQEGFEAFLGPV
jgi:hypothetical protein